MKYEKIIYYYSEEVAPEGKYPCDDNRVFAMLDALNSQAGVDVEKFCVDGKDIFRYYNAVTTGPPASIRSIFGAVRGAKPEDVFGKTLRCLACFETKADRRPCDVYPRSEEGTMIMIEEALGRFMKAWEIRG